MILDTKYRIPVYLSLGLCAVLCLTMNLYGVGIDESPYATAGRIYVTWAEHPIRNSIDANWGYNHEHPPLAKFIGGLSLRLFHDALGTVGLIKSFRLQNLVYCFALSFSMYLWMAELTSKYMGLVTVLITFFLPRLYFNAHIGTLDYPVTALIFISAYAFWRGLRNPKYMIVCSALMGLSLLTKINAAFLYAFLGLWMIVAWRKEWKTKWGYMLSFAGIPPALFVGLWPWLWPHPVGRLIAYGIWMTHHWPYYVYYLGRIYLDNTPWHYPLVLTIATLPVVILIAVLYYALCRRKSAVDYFLMLNAAIPIAAIVASPCKYSGVRLFLPAFPFICMMAGLGIYEYVKRGSAALTVCAVLIIGAVGFSIMEYHRYQECYYNEIVCLTGQNARFETEYEGCAEQEVLPWVNEHPDAKYYAWCGPSMSAYKASGQLDLSVAVTDYESADYVILLSQEGRFDKKAWDYRLNKTPVYAIREACGIPIVGIYKK